MTTDDRFVLIGDSVVNDIAIVDCDEELVDVSNFSEFEVDDRLADSLGHYRLLRTGLVERLIDASARLPKEMCFRIIEGYRPGELQQRYFDDYVNALTVSNPQLPRQDLLILASRYVAPPTGVPPHSTGGAVDLTLAMRGGLELDMGTAVNASPEQSGGACYTDALNIPDIARRNRKILVEALNACGIKNYPTEWWHWSYGERYWALLTGAAYAVYGSTAP